jgi:CDP-diacylglycerol pyrophosphatase
MKKQTRLLIVSIIVIAILSSCLGYKVVQSHRAEKFYQQVIISRAVQTYQRLENGDTDALKRDMGGVVKVQSEYYEKTYGSEPDTEFASMLMKAKDIRDEVAATSNPSK